jgi:hypothetical protein
MEAIFADPIFGIRGKWGASIETGCNNPVVGGRSEYAGKAERFSQASASTAASIAFNIPVPRS